MRIPLIVSWKGRTASARTDKLTNIGVDILPTMFESAGIAQPKKLPGRSVLPVALGNHTGPWRDHLVAQNNMSQTGTVDGIRPTMEGRMVRTDRYKYCVYEYGTRRESLFDLKNDPDETTDLAGDPKFQDILVQHRALLTGFGKEHSDALVAKLLADNVKPVPFPAAPPKNSKRKRARTGK